MTDLLIAWFYEGLRYVVWDECPVAALPVGILRLFLHGRRSWGLRRVVALGCTGVETSLDKVYVRFFFSRFLFLEVPSTLNEN